MFPLELEFSVPELFERTEKVAVTLHGPLTTLIGPNGTGKSILMRSMQPSLGVKLAHLGRTTKYLPPGRLGHLEYHRCNYDGQRQSWGEAEHYGFQQMADNHVANSETAIGLLTTLSKRVDLQVKVTERLSKLFNRSLRWEWIQGQLQVKLRRGQQEYTVAREASGLLQLIVILTALYDDRNDALLIDEPELSLHPQLQAFLFREISTQAGDPSIPNKKIIIVSTHSPQMLNLRGAKEIPYFVFLREGCNPIQVSPSNDLLQSTELDRVVKRLEDSSKKIFFSQRPLLVEGPSDSIICQALAMRLGLHLEATGCQILQSNGVSGAAPLIKLLRLVGKEPLVIADLDALIEGNLLATFENSVEIQQVALNAGHRSFSEFLRQIRDDFCGLVDSKWSQLFQKSSVQSIFEGLSISDPNKKKRRSVMIAMLAGQDSDSLWNSVRLRTISLLEYLEKCGCFFLRRGAIEDYGTITGISDKVTRALAEADSIETLTEAECVNHYSDVVRALIFAGREIRIDEAEMLRFHLASFVAPILQLESFSVERITGVLNLVPQISRGLFCIQEVENDAFQVALKSDSLIVTGFPLSFRRGANIKDVISVIQSG